MRNSYKLKQDPTKWSPKIFQQRTFFPNLNLPIDYDTAVMLNEEADDLAKQATTTSLPDTKQRAKHFPNTNVVLEYGTHWVESAFRPWIKQFNNFK